MAWLESHTVLSRHRKVKELARSLRLKPVYVMGHLHALWHDALEQQEDGDLTKWSDGLIAESSQFDGDAPQYVSLLQEHGWLDGRLIHDWLEYAGKFLISKYSTSNRERLVTIWRLHGLRYGMRDGKSIYRREIKRTDSEPKANLPNLTKPNHTLPNKTIKTNDLSAAPKSGAEAKPYEKPDPDTNPAGALICAYKVIRGIRWDDRAWDKIHYGRAAASAKSLIEVCGDLESAHLCIKQLSKRFKKANLTWTFETIVKHAHEWKLEGTNGRDDRKGFSEHADTSRTARRNQASGGFATSGEVLAGVRGLPILRNHPGTVERREDSDDGNGSQAVRVDPVEAADA